MHKHLSFALLTISIFGLNALPTIAVESTYNTKDNLEKLSDREENTDRDYQTIADGQWCVRIPAMGIFCWDL